FPDQRMSRMEALKSYTFNGAYAGFQEESRGSLKVGKYADIVVLSKDITKVPEDQIPSATVVYTIVGGNVLCEKTPAPQVGREPSSGVRRSSCRRVCACGGTCRRY